MNKAQTAQRETIVSVFQDGRDHMLYIKFADGSNIMLQPQEWQSGYTREYKKMGSREVEQ